MSENATEDTENLFDISDDAFLDMPESAISDNSAESSPSDEEGSQNLTEDTEGEDESEDTGSDYDPAEEEITSEDGEEPDDLEENDSDDDSVEDGDEDQPETTDEDSHADFYNKITAPFKAHGKEMQVSNPEDAIKLMQMGADYNRKMASMKPSLKVLKMLERNNLLDESKLNFLIDIDKKDPEAIKKLLKDSEMDPMEIDLESESSYKDSQHTMSDGEVALEEVVELIKDSPAFPTTLNIVTSQWDAESKQIVANQPQLIKVIHDQVENGIYDQISNAVEKERMFGRLDNVSDIEAYRQVGDRMQAEGTFDNLAAAGKDGSPAAKPDTAQQDAKTKERSARRQALKPTKRSAPKAKAQHDYNPLGMSDEEFMKEHAPNLLN